MANRVMIDLETLDTQPSAVIVSIGATRFGPGAWQPWDTFYLPVAFDPRDGRTVSRSAVAWWMQQPVEVQAALSDPVAVPLSGALGQLMTWIRNGGADEVEVWAGPATFDLAVLEHAYRAYGWANLPWKYNETRCYTTLRKDHPEVPRQTPGIAHNALSDAIAQAQHVCAIKWPEFDANK